MEPTIDPTIEPTARAFGWRGMFTAAAMALALNLAVNLVAMAFRSPGVAAFLTPLSFLAAGFFAARLHRGLRPLEAATGTSLAQALVSATVLIAFPAQVRDVSTGEVVLAFVIAVAFAFALGWLGARLGLPRTSTTRTWQQPRAPRPI